MHAGSYEIDIVVQGYPGKSVCHGGLGWSTIALIRGEGRIALVDVGSFSQRGLIRERLRARGLSPEQVTDVILTHSHWDHSINWVLFPNATAWIGADELAWSVAQPWGHTAVPEFYVRELDRSSRCRRIRPGDTVLPGMTADAAPGHTPGHLFFVLSTASLDILFTGDSAKNRAELLSLTADMTCDQAESRRSMEKIWQIWRRRSGTIVIPGHDIPMRLENDCPSYIGPREAAISAWFEDDLERTTLFSLALPAVVPARAAAE
ncbi:MAG: MBL fold metallo-hydrolase [Rhodospirillales bacterium]|nr:MBL fold metallo-hydrolase [Rhodospirillales bacterium]